MDTKKILEDLMLKKSEIENEIKQQGEILIAEGNIGMNEPLVDTEGFPRNDIDLYKVRLTRQHINCLQNDYKEIMQKIEDKLFEYHGEKRSNDNKIVDIKPASFQRSFLKVTQVDSGSPAQDCGIQVDDEVIQFGPYTSTNTDKKLTQIADLVKKSEDKVILLNIMRPLKIDSIDIGQELVRLKLIPKKWDGHGLLGCKIVPI